PHWIIVAVQTGAGPIEVSPTRDALTGRLVRGVASAGGSQAHRSMHRLTEDGGYLGRKSHGGSPFRRWRRWCCNGVDWRFRCPDASCSASRWVWIGRSTHAQAGTGVNVACILRTARVLIVATR